MVALVAMAGSPVLYAESWTVQSAVARAVASNSELRFARDRLRLQGRAQSLSVLDVMPNVGITYTDTGSVTRGGPDTYQSTLGFELSQLVYDRGAYWINRRQITAERQLATEDLVAQESQVATAFLELLISSLLNQERIAIRTELIANARDQFLIAVEEFDIGAITELDLLDVETQVLEQELTLEELKRTQTQLEFQINAALDLSPDSEVDFDADLNESFDGLVDELDVQTLTARARTENIQLRQARNAVAVAEDALRLARRVWLPQINANASVQFSGDQFPLSDPSLAVGVDLLWNLPVAPVDVGGDISRSDRLSRSRSTTFSTTIPTNVAGLTAQDEARLSALQAGTNLLDQGTALTFQIEQSVDEISSLRRSLDVGRRRLSVERRRGSIELVLLELGQLTRVDAVESQVRLANLEIDLIESVVELFRVELALLQVIGERDLVSNYAAIVMGFES